LHGIPYGIKDLAAARGYPTTWGAAPFKNRIIDRDATVVSRLRDAGAVLVAKLATGELALDDVWFGGQTKNPWDLSMGPQGSSAGPASATAAGLVGFSIGTETGGSIVEPSGICGVTGLRPTAGRVNRWGFMTLTWSLDKIGPMCRSVEDCAVVLNAIQGPDDRDFSVLMRMMLRRWPNFAA
jgi:Asp-tRNA(Asn)/Glu-tRNA(Gln) amidotransferase A subunit family amidase